MEIKKLNPEDLMNGLEYMSQIHSSADNIHTYMKSTMHVLLYNEIKKFTKEELESIKGNWKAENIYVKVMSSRCSLFFCALIEKDAFTDILDKNANWLLKNFPNNPDTYQSVYNIQSDCDRNKNEKEKFHIFFYYVASTVKKLDESMQKEIADKFFTEYQKSHNDDIIREVVSQLNSNEVFCSQIIHNFNERNIDINKNFPIDNYIKENSYRTEYSKFFISSTDIGPLRKLLEKGFRFDEDNFSRYGLNLLTSVLKSERVDIVTTLLPYLKMREPIGISMQEQHDLLKLYEKSNLYPKIKSEYYQKLYDYLLEDKDADKPKIKI